MLRGIDSTGIIVGDDKTYGTFKKAVNGADFLDMKKAASLINSNGLNRPAFMIGHNRAATVGSVNASNAHPFEHGSIAGVHNGTLRTYHRLDKNRDFGTDSEALYYNISTRPDLADVLGDIKGAYALVWYNSEENTVNIIRNDERPLAVAKVKDEDTVLWASEAGMLRWLAGRNGITLDHVMEPKANLHIKFDLNSGEVASFEFNQLEVKDNYPVYTPPVKTQSRTGTYNTEKAANELQVLKDVDLDKSLRYYAMGFKFEAYAQGGEFGQAVCYMTEAPFLEVRIRSVSKALFEKYYKGEHFQVSISEIKCPTGNYWETFCIGNKYNPSIEKDNTPEFNGPTGELISKSKMLSLTAQGCTLCSSGIGIAEFDFTDWIDGKPVCPDCIEKSNGYMEA